MFHESILFELLTRNFDISNVIWSAFESLNGFLGTLVLSV